MQRAAFAVITLASMCLIGDATRAASITYDIANYPALQAGYTVSGTITTDGTIGTSLVMSDIIAWNITISGGPNSFSTTSGTTSGAYNVTGNFIATPTGQLELAMPTTPVPNWLSFGLFSGSQLNWQRSDQNIPTQVPDAYACLGENFPSLTPLWGVSSHTLSIGGDPWIIAQIVPEPASLLMTSLGLAAVAVLAWRRRVAA